MRGLPPLACCALLLCLAATALAHRAPGSLTTVRYNERSGLTEIVHRLHLHDAALGVARALGEPPLGLENLEARAQVALYVAERFLIASHGKPLQLDVIGAEIEGDYLLVYQEHAGRLPPVITLRDDILRDSFPRQINQVNIADDERVRTVTFSGDDGWHRFRFGAAAANGVR